MTTVGVPPVITVHLLLFAAYAERAGRSECDLTLEAPATVADVLHRFGAVYPATGQLPPRPLVAVNQTHATTDTVVQQGDEVAILPPLAGG